MPRSESIASRLYAAQLFIENTLAAPDLLAVFATAQRDAAYFEAARTLHADVQTLHHQCARARGERIAARHARDEAHAGAAAIYMRHLGLARIAFKGDGGAQTALQLRGRRKSNLMQWVGQVLTFYDNILSDDDRKEAMAALGVDEAELVAARAAAAAVGAADRIHQGEMGDSEQATQRRDAALANLDAWMSENTALARLLFPPGDQRLEKIGLMVRS